MYTFCSLKEQSYFLHLLNQNNLNFIKGKGSGLPPQSDTIQKWLSGFCIKQ